MSDHATGKNANLFCHNDHGAGKPKRRGWGAGKPEWSLLRCEKIQEDRAVEVRKDPKDRGAGKPKFSLAELRYGKIRMVAERSPLSSMLY